jgi:hypothetical protein
MVASEPSKLPPLSRNRILPNCSEPIKGEKAGGASPFSRTWLVAPMPPAHLVHPPTQLRRCCFFPNLSFRWKCLGGGHNHNNKAMMMRRPRFSNRRIGAATAGKENNARCDDPNVPPSDSSKEFEEEEEKYGTPSRSERTTMTEEEDCSSVGMTSARRSTQKSLSSSVTFETVTVREFGYELGDHPLTRDGVPLSLSWEPFDERSYSVDKYEQMKCSPPGFPGIVLSTQQRRDILIRAGYPVSLLLQAEVELEQRRRQLKVSRHAEEQRRLRQRRFVKDLCSLRFGIVGASSSPRKMVDKRTSRASHSPSLSAR